MSNGIMAISELVKKCKILLLDIEGTTTSISFVKDKLFPYAEENVKKFLDAQWEKDDVKEAVAALRKLAAEDKENTVEGVVEIPGEDASKDDQIQALVDSVKWQMSKDRKSGALKLLQGLVWKQGYDNGDIKGHVYEDVSPAMGQWRSVEGQKIYIYSSGSVQAQKLLFNQSTAGDLLPLIDGHFDTAVGPKREAASYTAIVEKIGSKADDILFLTDIVEEAEAAKSAGLQTALVDREGGVTSTMFPVITSMAQLVAAQKRKPDEQSDEPAPKVAKTETEVKDSSDVTTPDVSSEKKAQEVSEKMEVEDSTTQTSADIKEKETEPVAETKVAEKQDSKEADNVITTKAEPIVSNAKSVNENTDKKEDKMDTDNTETVTPPAETKCDKAVNGNNVTEIITEIKEISNDEPNSEGAEAVDIEPIVEEPANDTEELKTAGETLEKECSDILSKVEDVTNKNIPVKPVLNSIAEETMEVENNDSAEKEKETDTEKEIVSDVKDAEQTNESKTSEESSAPKDKKDDETSNNVPEEKPAQDPPTDIKDTVNKIVEKDNEVKNSELETKTSIEEDKKPTESPVETEKPIATDKSVETEKSIVTDKPVEKLVESNAENDKTEHSDKKSPVVEEKVEPKSEETELKTNGTQSEENKESEVESNGEEKKSEEKKPETEAKEPHMNGNATNGDTAKMNGNGKVEELNDRLTENGVGAVNGTNGKSDEKIEGNGDSKADIEVAEIKVKSVADVEERTEPIDQATEA